MRIARMAPVVISRAKSVRCLGGRAERFGLSDVDQMNADALGLSEARWPNGGAFLWARLTAALPNHSLASSRRVAARAVLARLGHATLATSMRRLRSAFAFIDRYVTLAGKSCCRGQTERLRKSVARRTKESP